MTFEEWKEKHNDLIENVAITFFNYGCGVDTKTCYDELEYLLKKAFNAGKTNGTRLLTVIYLAKKVVGFAIKMDFLVFLTGVQSNGLIVKEHR